MDSAWIQGKTAGMNDGDLRSRVHVPRQCSGQPRPNASLLNDGAGLASWKAMTAVVVNEAERSCVWCHEPTPPLYGVLRNSGTNWPGPRVGATSRATATRNMEKLVGGQKGTTTGVTMAKSQRGKKPNWNDAQVPPRRRPKQVRCAVAPAASAGAAEQARPGWGKR